MELQYKRTASVRVAGTVGGFVALCVLLLVSARLANPQQPAIQITSPASGALFAPGATVTVSVALGPGVAVKQVIILGENPIGLSDALTSAPFQFPISIPTNINAGLYHLTADATGAQGQDLQSASIVIDVEPSVGIASFKVQPGIIRFRFVGDSAPIRVVGMVATGGQIDLTESTRISYTSSKTTVASVSQAGIVTAVGPGTASITVNGLAAPFAIPVFVPGGGRGDLNADGSVDDDDLNILVSALNTPATKPVDARDLNGDGVINALDARILVTLCTRPACATH